MHAPRTRTAVAAAATVAALAMAGCGGSSNGGADDAEFVIGAAVVVSHPALQAVQDGFEEVLDEEGIDYRLIEQNAQGDQANAPTIASSFASDPDIDLMLAISTPIALALANAEQERPILFSAVTDPVRDGLVESWDAASGNITGTSDLGPGANPVEVVTQAMPGAQTLGVLYSSSESNSLAQVEAFQAEADSLGIELKTQGITSAAEVSVGLAALEGVDAILVPTDNTVIAAIASVIGWGQENQVPVFAADSSTVEEGTVATRGLSYHELGRATGEMAVRILRDGVDVGTIAPVAPTSDELVVNPGAAESFGLTLPQAFVDSAARVVENQ